jgi:hypothetical protein
VSLSSFSLQQTLTRFLLGYIKDAEDMSHIWVKMHFVWLKGTLALWTRLQLEEHVVLCLNTLNTESREFSVTLDSITIMLSHRCLQRHLAFWGPQDNSSGK